MEQIAAPSTAADPVIRPEDITWELSSRARQEIGALGLSPDDHREAKQAIRKALCEYFTTKKCMQDGNGISAMASKIEGCRGIKLRWALPGRGKRGGLRMAVAVFCSARRVKIGAIFVRKTDPGEGEFQDGFAA